jgi:hypothetical protein
VRLSMFDLVIGLVNHRLRLGIKGSWPHNRNVRLRQWVLSLDRWARCRLRQFWVCTVKTARCHLPLDVKVENTLPVTTINSCLLWGWGGDIHGQSKVDQEFVAEGFTERLEMEDFIPSFLDRGGHVSQIRLSIKVTTVKTSIPRQLLQSTEGEWYSLRSPGCSGSRFSWPMPQYPI